MNSNKPNPKKQKPATLLIYEMLTAAEIEQLQQEKKDDSDFFQKAFSEKTPKYLK